VVPLCLIPILMIVVRVVVHFAQFAVVLENMGVVDGLRRGWAILKANFVNALILGVILFVIGIVVAIIVAIPIAVAVVALVVPFAVQTSAAASQARPPDFTLLAIAGLCFVCYLPILIVVAAIYRTWDAAVWTLAYRFFAGNTPAPALPVAPSAPLRQSRLRQHHRQHHHRKPRRRMYLRCGVARTKNLTGPQIAEVSYSIESPNYDDAPARARAKRRVLRAYARLEKREQREVVSDLDQPTRGRTPRQRLPARLQPTQRRS
jgi:hypothetical protein